MTCKTTPVNHAEVTSSLTKLSNDQVHAYAVYCAAAEAIRKTMLPVEVRSEPRRYRLKVGGRLVQVFGKRSDEWQLSDALKPLAPDTDAVVFVDLEGEHPEFYPVPADWFRHDVERRYTEYLARVGTRPKNPDSRHYAVPPSHVVRWWDKWDVFSG
ncbi:hypothetical protein SAMN04488564_102714 [Lentzea waywayandensis]|uniref:Uncharacterized protein n=1 Tax=Lentzea waywayandensis TaxID=84724 RepID=A0A1I6DIC8_9PSEU|nr:hypothetical protein SAMN04488564_102714 [Lentzea waywayandensis]